jgi:hypothetical protein
MTDLQMIRDYERERAALLRKVSAVESLHEQERRYTCPAGEASYDTAEEAAEAWDIPLEQVEHFDICKHCGSLEMGDEDDYGHEYKESLWPCSTRHLMDLNANGDPR